MPVQNGGGAGIEKIALQLKLLHANFFYGVRADDFPGPGLTQCVHAFKGEGVAVSFAHQHLVSGDQSNPCIEPGVNHLRIQQGGFEPIGAHSVLAIQADTLFEVRRGDDLVDGSKGGRVQTGLPNCTNCQGVPHHIAEPPPAAGAGIGFFCPPLVQCILQSDGQAPGELLDQAFDNLHIQLTVIGLEPVGGVIGQVVGLCVDGA